MLNRRSLMAALPALAAASACASTTRSMTVYKTASCQCCEGWISAMNAAGFSSRTVEVDDIVAVWRSHGVPDELSACHLATLDGYVSVGHVPPADIERLLRERPKAIGLSVPGMPMGSPGMEMVDGEREPFDTLLILPGGERRVFARHA